MGGRFIDENFGLFGSGVSGGSSYEIKCEWCGTIHNKDYDGAEDGDGNENLSGDYVSYLMFGDKEICECCFDKIEAAVMQYMPYILPWYRRILDAQRRRLEKSEENLSAVQELEGQVPIKY